MTNHRRLEGGMGYCSGKYLLFSLTFEGYFVLDRIGDGVNLDHSIYKFAQIIATVTAIPIIMPIVFVVATSFHLPFSIQ